MTVDKNNNYVSQALRAEGLHQPELAAELPPRAEEQTFRGYLRWYGAICVSGLGMFMEAYILITTGQVKSLWKNQYPTCWASGSDQHCPNLIECCGLFPNTPTLANGTCVPQFPEFCQADGTYPGNAKCHHRATHALSYSEFAGIMAGMVFMGLTADYIGRVNAGVITACMQIVGVTMMAFVSTDNLRGQFLTFAAFFGLFGMGVGGEYPITATNAAVHNFMVSYEGLNEEEEKEKRKRVEANATTRRGETIALAFTMQGVGAVTGSLFVVIMIYFGQQQTNSCDPMYGSNSMGTDPRALSAIWRSFYFIGGIIVFMFMLYRFLILEEGEVFQRMLDYVKERDRHVGKVTKFQVVRFYLFRLLGTGGNWLLMDIAFYGTKLFSAPIFHQINPKGLLLPNNGYLLVNNLCGLVGYYCCAALVDYPKIGRKKLQLFSFIANFVIFVSSAARFHQMPTGLLMFLFFFTNFIVNFGANTTTYVMAAETYPVELRGTCHGLSAFSGKVGALIATIVFGYLTAPQIFYVCCGTNLAGFIMTVLFSADMTGVSLDEHAAQLELWLEGRPEEYKGVLNKPEHLSNFEIWTGMHGEYDPDWINKLLKKDNPDEESSGDEVNA